MEGMVVSIALDAVQLVQQKSQTDKVWHIHEKGEDLFNFHFQGLIIVSRIEFPF